MSNLPTALIFDVDGSMAETGCDGHRLAYNNTFMDFSLVQTYNDMSCRERKHIKGFISYVEQGNGCAIT